jgi:hypothetical protein|tara:strand:+ start:1931 stop:2326 length:396 start_codon:yes stop_codon:yes gene_type:complete
MELPSICFTRQIQTTPNIPLLLILYNGRQLINQINEQFEHNVVRYIEVYQVNNNQYINRIRLYLNHWSLIELINRNENTWYYHVRFNIDTPNHTYYTFNNCVVNNDFVLGQELGIIQDLNLIEINGTMIQY